MDPPACLVFGTIWNHILCLCFVELLSSTIKKFEISSFKFEILLRAGLANLLLQFLAYKPDAFLLVWVRRTQAAHVRRHLPDFLAIDSGHGQLGLLGINRNRDSRRQR